MWGWTSVQDALPETEGRYIVASLDRQRVFVANFAHNLASEALRLTQSEKPGWWNSDDEAVWFYRDITHWMPFPDLPYK